MSIPTTVTLTFIALKVTGIISWSWWWVFSPTLAYLLVLGVGFWFIIDTAKRKGVGAIIEKLEKIKNNEK